MHLATVAMAATLLWAQLGYTSAAQVTQADDPYALLEGAARAMAPVETMRFSSSSETRLAGEQPPPGARPTESALQSWGEFQAPDRVRLVNEGIPSFEIITIGRTWTRTGNSSWRTASQGPTGLTEQLREASQLLVNPAVTDDGGNYIVSGELDASRAGTTGSNVGSLFGSSFGGITVPGMESGGNAIAVFTIEKSTLYLRNVQVTTPMSAPAGGFLLPGMSASTILTLWDFNDPSIAVEEPR